MAFRVSPPENRRHAPAPESSCLLLKTGSGRLPPRYGLGPMAPGHRFGYPLASPRLVTVNPPPMKSSTKNQATGTAKIASGKVKETTGRLVGNPRLEAKGKSEQTEGRLQKKVGQIEKVLDQ